jgi:transcriptional regulator with XRE-family HTH domain
MKLEPRKSNTLPSSIKNIMEKHSLSNTDLAKEVGVTGQAIANWLKGTKPKEEVYNKLKGVFDKYEEASSAKKSPVNDGENIELKDILLSQASLAQIADRARELGMEATFKRY